MPFMTTQHVDHMTFAELTAEHQRLKGLRAWGARFFEIRDAIHDRSVAAWRNYDVFGTSEADTLAKSDAVALDRKAREVVLKYDSNGHPLGEVSIDEGQS